MKNIGMVVGVVVLGLAVLLYYNQNAILYHPYPPGVPRTPAENPAGYNAPSEYSTTGHYIDERGPLAENASRIEYEEAFVQAVDGVRLHTWLIFHPNHSLNHPLPTLIYFHGNAGNLGFRLPNAIDFVVNCGMNVLMMDYRGYGSSDPAAISERGLQLDAKAVLEHALKHPKLRGSKIILFGRSLGGAVSIDLAYSYRDDDAKKNPISMVIVENTFLSIDAMIKVLFRPAYWILSPLSTNQWRSEDKIPHLHQPILFISGLKDELIPPEQMVRLHALAEKSTKKDLYAVARGTHNDTWYKGGKDYYEKIKNYIQEHLGL